VSGNGKLVLIGLDGATFRVLRPLVDAGVMPTVARFMREGAWGNLLSTRPPVTCPAWPTMFTGVNPGKHGVFSFSYRDSETGRMRTASSADVRAPRIWDMIGDAGKRVAILNVPITFPAERVNGTMLTGFVSPDESPHITWPASLRQELRDEFTNLCLNWDVLGYRPRERGRRERHIRRINELMALRSREFEHIVGRNECEFCFLVHEYPDRVHHLFYHILDPVCLPHRSPDNRTALQLLHEGYRALDDSLARLAERFGEHTNYMLVSDHGFDGVTRWVYMNNLLEQHDLLALKGFKTWADVVSRRLNVPASTRQWLGLEQREAWHRQDPFCAPLLDYGRTKAFAGPQLEHAIHVNVRGRCPEGIVEPGEEYEKVRREVIQVLQKATDPETGKRVFDGAWAREELYSGQYIENAPDVIYELAPGYMVSNASLPSSLLRGRFLRRLRAGWDVSGYHRPEGILIGFGPAFRSAQGLKSSILDVAPTVLYLMDLPIPRHMDGRIVEEALSPELLRSRPRRTCDVDPKWESTAEATLTDRELTQLTQRLEDLGYL
jgi:predicted AlkP superfamily phosphohydrolase/phosphomutase